jgi:PAS domain S-box-containing protein
MASLETLEPDEFFSAAALSSPDSISISHLDDGRYIAVNPAFLETTGYRTEEVIGKTSIELGIWVDSLSRERFLERLSREGRVRDMDVRFRLKSGELRSFRMSAAVLRLGGRDCLTASIRDVTERLQLFESLEKGRFLLQRAEEIANIGSWELDYKTGRISVSPGSCRIYGIAEEDFTVKAVEQIPLAEYRGPLDRARDELINEGKPYDIEFRIKRKADGELRDIHSKALWDEANRRMFGIIRDVTEEKETAAGLRRALVEKETLLRELYHRTKNNMQVIAALLGLEVSKDPQDRVREVFEEVQRRIDSMALVHEMLYSSGDLSRIDLAEFVPSLARLLVSSLGDRAAKIGFSYRIGKLELTIDEAVPCGLILNELIVNAAIHAFPGGRAGTIAVEARREADGTVEIAVSDDGVGAAGMPAPKEDGAHGLSLVTSIGRSQLGGSVTLSTGEKGFSCVLRFRSQRGSERLGPD